ncbi:MAG: enoyl-CoA hydratase [Granulosicoccus sp.]
MSTLVSENITDSPLLVEHTAGITRLTLNRPKQFNALSNSMLEALQQGIDSLPDSTRVVVIRARGRAFCAGHDLKEMRAHPEQAYYQALFNRCSHFMQSLIALPMPVIAEVQGIATAAGCQLVANCDLAIASTDARFAVSGINMGLFCSTPSVALSRNVSRKRAFEMLMTGDFISARTAAGWGLVNRAVAPEELESAVADFCKTIIDKSSVAVSTGKSLFYEQLDMPLDDAYTLAGAKMACNMMSNDVGEGIDAFMQKRKPEWTHS